MSEAQTIDADLSGNRERRRPRRVLRWVALTLPRALFGLLTLWAVAARGIIATNLPFAELKKQSLVNARAKAADQDPAFSQRIRQNLP